jgi:hypothetical protein
MFSQFDQRLAALEEQVSKLQEQNKTLEKENAELKAKSSHRAPLYRFIDGTVIYINKTCAQHEYDEMLFKSLRVRLFDKLAIIDIDSLSEFPNLFSFNISGANQENLVRQILFYSKGEFICSTPMFEQILVECTKTGTRRFTGFHITNITENTFKLLTQAFADVKMNLMFNSVLVSHIEITFAKNDDCDAIKPKDRPSNLTECFKRNTLLLHNKSGICAYAFVCASSGNIFYCDENMNKIGLVKFKTLNAFTTYNYEIKNKRDGTNRSTSNNAYLELKYKDNDGVWRECYNIVKGSNLTF